VNTKSPADILLDTQTKLFLEIAESRTQGDTVVRFGRPWVAASNIADQYYCEQKVELRCLLGEIETEVKQQGSEGHDELAADAITTSRHELFQQIFSEQLTVAQEIFLLARYKGLILVGQPDAVAFHHGCALFLFEFKFSRSRIPYHSYHVQAHVYGKILESMNIDIQTLYYAIAIIPPSLRHEKALFHKIVQAVLDHGPHEASFPVEESHVHIYAYHTTSAEDDIDWALEYWRSQRDAVSTRNPNKCARCEYEESCTRKPDAI
jgi:CRISPR/Cas system-associated exonuclease Cas4 (RecB family)